MNMVMSLLKHRGDAGDIASKFQKGCHGIYMLGGSVTINGKTINHGEACYLSASDDRNLSLSADADMLHFALHRQSDHISEATAIQDNIFEMDEPLLLRLDQVCFPVGAQAFRHIHHGAGIRVLIDGEIDIISDHDRMTIQTGGAWFEDVASPVQAIPQNEKFASFIRAMAIPARFEGQSTIEYLDEADKKRPKLQTTQRFFDQPIRF